MTKLQKIICPDVQCCCTWMLFSALQVLVMITHTLCTKRTTLTCLVQTTSRNSLIGPHISKHWCHSCAPTSGPPAVCVYPVFDYKLLFLQASLLTFNCFPTAIYLLSWPLKERNKRGWADRYIALSVSWSVILSAEHAEVKILFQAKLYLCHHHLGSLRFNASHSLNWHQAHTTAYRVNRYHFAAV